MTATSTAPNACCGAVAVMDVAVTTDTSVAGAPPIVTDAPAEKLFPVIVTLVPPNVVPVAGTILVIVTDEGLVGDPQADATTANAVANLPRRVLVWIRVISLRSGI